MPSMDFDATPSEMPNGRRFMLNLMNLSITNLKPRNHKRPHRYVGRRHRTAVILTVAKGRGQRKA